MRNDPLTYWLQTLAYQQTIIIDLLKDICRGVEQLVACLAHHQEVGGSSPPPAPKDEQEAASPASEAAR